MKCLINEIVIGVNLLEFTKSELVLIRLALVRQQRYDAASKVRSVQQANQAIEDELSVIIK